MWKVRLDVMTLGNANPDSLEDVDIVSSGGPAHGYYRRLVLKDNVLIGAVLINRIEQGGILRALIENRVPLDLTPSALLSPSFNFSRLLP